VAENIGELDPLPQRWWWLVGEERTNMEREKRTIVVFSSSEWHRTSGTHTETLLEPGISETAERERKAI